MTAHPTLEITNANFEEIIRSDKPTLIDFWAPWCGPCRALGPTIEKLANDLGERAQIAKVNIDEHPQLAAQYGVASIPTVIIFKDGHPTDQFVGIRPYSEYLHALEN